MLGFLLTLTPPRIDRESRWRTLALAVLRWALGSQLGIGRGLGTGDSGSGTRNWGLGIPGLGTLSD